MARRSSSTPPTARWRACARQGVASLVRRQPARQDRRLFNYVIAAALFLCAGRPASAPRRTLAGACRCSRVPTDFAAQTPRPTIIFFSAFLPTGISSSFISTCPDAPLWLNAFLTIALSILVFVPIKFIYPSRAPRFRASIIFFGASVGNRRLSGYDLSCRRRRRPWRLPRCSFQLTIRRYRFGSNFVD